MKKERYDFVCLDTEAGIDAFVTHLSTKEDGRVLSCDGDNITVETPDGEIRNWDYRECEEISRRKDEWPWR